MAGKNKANLEGRHQGAGIRQRTKLAKQSQFRWRASDGKCLVEKELWWIFHVHGPAKTKPILGGAGWDGVRGSRDVGFFLRSSTLWPPALPDRLCKTNPIFGRSRAGACPEPAKGTPNPFAVAQSRLYEEPILRNKANFQEEGSRRQGAGIRGPTLCAKQSQTWVRWGIWAATWRGGFCAKQTQFGGAGARGKCF